MSGRALLGLAIGGAVIYYIYNKNTQNQPYQSYKSIDEKMRYQSKILLDRDLRLNKMYGHRPNVDYYRNIIRRRRRGYNNPNLGDEGLGHM